MNYCMECGTKLEEKFLEDEGMVPYCPSCGQYRFPVFNVAVSMIVIDEKSQKILLIEQYGRPFYILVAGYINRGECAEHAVVREVMEETGLEVKRLQFNRSKFFEPSNTLMENFTCFVEDGSAIHVNREVDAYQWFTFDEAKENIKPESLAREFLVKYLEGIGK